MVETNLQTASDTELYEAAQVLLDAAMDYWEVYRRVIGGAAVVWVKDTDGRMVVLTRGEYQAELMRNIDRLYRDSDDQVSPFHIGKS